MKIETLEKLIESEIERNDDHESLLAEIMILIDLYEKDSKPSYKVKEVKFNPLDFADERFTLPTD